MWREVQADRFVRVVARWSGRAWWLAAALLLGTALFGGPPAVGAARGTSWFVACLMVAAIGHDRDRYRHGPVAPWPLAYGVLVGGGALAQAGAAWSSLHPLTMGGLVVAGVAGLAQLAALWRVRRAVRTAVADRLDRISPPGAIPFAPLLPDVGRMCDAAGLLGIGWIVFGLLVVAFEGVTGPPGHPPDVTSALLAGWSGVGGGVWMLAARGTVARGLRGDAATLRRGLFHQIAASTVAGGPLYWHAFLGGLAGGPVPGALWCLVPLVLPATFALVLVFFGRAFETRAELRRVEDEWSRALGTGDAAAEAAIRAQANALRQELGMQELPPPGTVYTWPASASFTR